MANPLGEATPRGFFFGWLTALISVQPFADEVGDNVCHDRDYNSDYCLHQIHLLSGRLEAAPQQPYYTIIQRTPQDRGGFRSFSFTVHPNGADGSGADGGRIDRAPAVGSSREVLCPGRASRAENLPVAGAAAPGAAPSGDPSESTITFDAKCQK